MRRFTKTEKINGEYACRNLSAKADGLTFDELNELFEELADEIKEV